MDKMRDWTVQNTESCMISSVSSEENSCDTLYRFIDAAPAAENEYARAFVVPQSYQNCSKPCEALKRGSFFEDLYMPFVTMNPSCNWEDAR